MGKIEAVTAVDVFLLEVLGYGRIDTIPTTDRPSREIAQAVFENTIFGTLDSTFKKVPYLPVIHDLNKLEIDQQNLVTTSFIAPGGQIVQVRNAEMENKGSYHITTDKYCTAMTPSHTLRFLGEVQNNYFEEGNLHYNRKERIPYVKFTGEEIALRVYFPRRISRRKLELTFAATSRIVRKCNKDVEKYNALMGCKSGARFKN